MIRVARRAFLQGLGLSLAGLALVHVRGAEAAPKAEPGFSPNVLVHVAPDGVVTIVCPRSEMGQGIRSSLPVLVADEMGASLEQVKVVQADGDAKYGDQNTDGSRSIRGPFDDLRKAGATARAMLIGAAARKWGVPAKACEAHDHAVFHPPSKRTLGFGALAPLAAKLPVPKDAPLRAKGEWKYVGKPLPVHDAPDIVVGKAIFAADVKLPGLLTAVIARPPVVGGKVKSHDASKALLVKGVKKVVELPAPSPPYAFQPLGGVAVVAEGTWAAMQGRAALKIEWLDGDNAEYDSAKYAEALTAAVRAPGRVVRRTGDVDAALAAAKTKVDAEYHVPHLSHVPMEPPCAVAHVTAAGCEVWSATQDPQTTRKEVAKALGLDVAKVTVHVTLLGGGFGRKSKPDYAVEAALLSRAAGAPVRVQWMREDDVRHDYYHTVSTQKLVAALDASGKVTGWLHRIAFPSIRSTFKPGVVHADEGELGQGVLDLPLAVPNVRAENGEAPAHVRIGWLRSVNNIHHGFAIGSFVDELAHARGKDARETWLDILGAPRIVTTAELGVDKVPNYGTPLDKHPIDTARHRRVLERVTEMCDWKNKKGRALGLSVHRSFLTYVATVVSVVLDPKGKPHVEEAWVACDAGLVVNPDRARAQMEGAVVFGMSLALHGSITMKNGAVEQTNFRDYRLVRIAEAPRATHVELVDSDAPPGGIGEPGVPPVAPALANAVFALTGKRVRTLPILAAF